MTDRRQSGHYRDGVEAKAAGRFVESIGHFRRALELEPGDASILMPDCRIARKPRPPRKSCRVSCRRYVEAFHWHEKAIEWYFESLGTGILRGLG